MTGGWLVILAVAAEVLVLTVGIVAWVATSRRLARAMPASGVVTESRVERDMSGTSASSSSILRVTVSYVDAAGSERVGRWSGQPGLFSSGLPVHSRVTLRYDPLRPEWITIADREHPLLVVGVVTVAFLLAVPLALFIVSRALL